MRTPSGARMTLQAILLDFDGVIVESVDIKTRAFREIFAREVEHVDAIVALHCAKAGVSRYEKFEAIYRDILRRPLAADEMYRLGERFAALVVEQVVTCPLVPGALEFLEDYSARLPLLLVSGTPEVELEEILKRRSLGRYFFEVHGSPRSKSAILTEVLRRHRWGSSDVLFVGDSTNDWAAAEEAGVPFVGFVPAGVQSPFPAEVPLVGDLRKILAAGVTRSVVGAKVVGKRHSPVT